MQIKRLFAYGAAGLLMAGMAVMPVSAHGHHGQAGAAKQTVCSVCTVEGCTTTGLHTHDNTTYCGYAHAGAGATVPAGRSAYVRWKGVRRRDITPTTVRPIADMLMSTAIATVPAAWSGSAMWRGVH